MTVVKSHLTYNDFTFRWAGRDESGISDGSELEFLKLLRLSIALQVAQLICKNHQLSLWKNFCNYESFGDQRKYILSKSP